MLSGTTQWTSTGESQWSADSAPEWVVAEYADGSIESMQITSRTTLSVSFESEHTMTRAKRSLFSPEISFVSKIDAALTQRSYAN